MRCKTYLILWQTGKGFDDGCQGHLALFCQIGSAGQRVGGAAHEPGTGISCDQQKGAFLVHHEHKNQKKFRRPINYTTISSGQRLKMDNRSPKLTPKHLDGPLQVGPRPK